MEKNGLLCYPKCEKSYYGVGPVCWQKCESGYTDDGALCRRPLVVYGRQGHLVSCTFQTFQKQKTFSLFLYMYIVIEARVGILENEK